MADNPYTDAVQSMQQRGNIDLANRPVVRNADGSVSTVRSISVGIDGKEVLIPTVSEDGRVMANDEAIRQYRETGRYLGKFDTPDEATAYAETLHERQAERYVNPYDAAVVDMASRRKSQLRSSIAEAINTNPDSYAKSRALSEQTGVPAPIVERNFDDVNRKAKVNEYDKLLQDTPALAEFMRSPDFAKLAHDDLDNAGVVERSARSIAAALPSFNAASYGVGQAFSEWLAGGFELLPDGLLPANPAVPLAQYFAEQRTEQAAAARRWQGDLSGAGSFERGVYSGLRSAAQNIPLLAGALVSKNPSAALTAMSGIVFGQEYGEAREQGVEPGQALLYGLSQATVEYATEKIPVFKLLGDVEKRTGFMKTVAAQLATEIPGEQVATLFQDLNQWAVLNPEKPFAEYLAERPSAATETLFATLVAVGAQTGGAKGVEAVSHKLSGEQQRAGNAEATLRQLAELAQAAGDSKLRTRAPDSFEQFVADAGKDGELQDVYIEAKVLGDVLNQSGISPGEAAPAIAEQIDEALAVNGDVRIPVSQFAARIAGQDYAEALLPHLRADPEAMSAAEAETFNQGAADQFKAEAEKTLAQQDDRDAFEASAENVAANLRTQLEQANRFTPDVNNAYASLMRDFYVVAAERLGITPEEMYQRYPLRVVAEGVEGGLDQSAAPAGIPRADSLTPEDREIESRFAETVQADPDAAIEAYNQLEDAEGGLVLNTDVARELSPDYLANRTKSAAVHEPASFLVKEIYRRRLAEIEQAGGGQIMFSAGGTGAGKTTGIKKLNLSKGTDLIYDTNMGGLDGAVDKIERALGAVESVKVVYTYRDPVDALVNGMLSRAKRQVEEFGTGRTVPLIEHVKTHVGSRQVIQQLMDRYAEDERVEFTIIDNSRGKDNAAEVDLTSIPDLSYDAVLGETTNALEAQNLAGLVPEEIYDAVRLDSEVGSEDRAQVGPGAAKGGSSGTVQTNRGQSEPAHRVERPALAQGEPAAPRGQIRLDEAGATIALLKNADLSTFLHESGHFFLEVYADLTAQDNAPAGIADDFNALLKWFGVKDAATWQGMTLEQRRKHHEKFARGFEAYLFEGKAPTLELRPLFSRFRTWLLSVYKTLNNLNVELDDEVRAVFGRMLATEAAIAATEEARQFAPLFETAEDAGMTGQEFEAYVEANTAAKEKANDQLQKRSLRDMRWLSGAKSKVLKALQKDADAKRKAVRAEVAGEVAEETVYKARRFIRRGEIERDGEVVKIADHKLSLAALQEMYPEGEFDWSQLTGGGKYQPVSAKGGLHPDFVAEMLGYDSGDALIKTLFSAPPINDTIGAATDQRMLERYGDLTDLAALERAADEAVHNEARARFVATEIRALNRILNVRQRTPAGGSVNVTLKAAREFAEATIARLRIRDVRPAKFRAAETRAAKAADRELQSGNTLAAATEKRNQLVNTRATRAAYDAQNEIEKGLRYLNKFSRDGVRKNIDLSYVDQIDQLLERFDLRKRQPTQREMAKRKSLAEWVEAQRELGFEPAIDEAILAEARRQPYREMSVEEFRGLVDAVRNIEHLGRLKNKLLTAQKDRRFDEAVDEAVSTIEENARKTIPEELEHNAYGARVKKGLKGFFAMHRKFASIVRQMDGFQDGGPLWELFIRPLNAAADKEAAMREAATVELTKLFKPMLAGAPLRQKMFIPAIGKSLSREGRLAVALNWGNKTNRLRVMEGDKWSEAQAQSIIDTLTKEEWDFVQSVWDHINSYWPAVQEKEQRVTGLRPQKVEADPVQTKFGEYRGGYYPIAYDPERSSRAEADTMAESLRQAMQGLYTRATTRRGHTKARVESVKRPMRKDLGVIFQHVGQVAHDLAFHEYLIDANRLLRHSGVDAAIRAHYGPEILRELRNALDDTARGDVPAQNDFERAIHHIRVGATIAGLGWNLTTGMLQPIGLTQSVVRIGPKYVGRGLARWFGSAARMESSVAWIHEQSDMMRLRHKTMQREINEIQNTIHGGKRMTPVKSSFFYLIQKLQMVADVPTWLGAYEKAMDVETDEVRAIALADQAVLDAQGGGQIKDLAGIQRGGPLMKLWTNFYSFFSTTYNLSAESVRRTNFKKPGDVGRLAVDYLLLYTIPATLAFFMREALRGDGDDDDLAKELARENLSFMLSTVMGVREFSGVVQGFSYRGTAGQRGFQEVARVLEQAQQGELDAAALKALNAAGGVVFHYPAGQVQRTVEGAVALMEGDTDNPMALVAGPERK